MISCRTLGPADVRVDGRDPPPELLWRKNLGLLVYLARSPTRGRTREHLMALLWPDSGDRAARHSLREAIRVIRQASETAAIDAAGERVQLVEGTVELDTDRFDALWAAGQWLEAATLIGGDFLEGFGIADASPFEDWLSSERLAWRRRSVDALVKASEDLAARGDMAAAADMALRAARADPSSESATTAGMRYLVLAGDRTSALAHFDRYAEHLRASTDLPPGSEASALAARIRSGRVLQSPRYLTGAPSEGAESRRAPLVSRAEGLGRLTECWATARDRHSSAVALILGDAGTGKTRLAEEVAERARLDGATVAMVSLVPADKDTPWSAIRGLVRGGLLEASGLLGAAPEAIACFAREVPEWAERFPGLAATEGSRPIGTALQDILHAASQEQPIVLVLDDVQWSDRPSLDTITMLARDLSKAPMLLVLTGPLHHDADTLDDLRTRVGRDLQGATVSLSALEHDGIRTLAAWALPAYDDDALDRVTRRVLHDSAGLPLLVVELLHAIAVGLDVERLGGTWPQPMRTLDQTMPGDLPDTIVAAIRTGFRRLSRDAQTALGAVAAVGERVTADTARRATGLEPSALAAALDELEWQRWLTASGQGYVFVARLAREVVLHDMLTPGQQQRFIRDSQS